MSDSKSLAFGRGGSSPPIGTTYYAHSTINYDSIIQIVFLQKTPYIESFSSIYFSLSVK